ncbi:hypothetical protein P872_12030 [Rhodonellum psychrophilum GCM71 = DSM 17998]|uniref:Uncharacterized protein n=1 Tax=Rhodonellum psychrophilum GCM71 = DSM 17998 TaxID=1123057 RepID=U5BU01_9BACT|nr:hypothetical protein P872_12030 [Rhodonellum psychrophilum GCM71 = DSM 17998]
MIFNIPQGLNPKYGIRFQMGSKLQENQIIGRLFPDSKRLKSKTINSQLNIS